MYSVYCHQNKINGKKYIGITCKIPKYRWGSRGQNYGGYFGNAITKYGWNNFEHLILYSDITKEEAVMFEQYLIEAFSTNVESFGYNLTIGGDGVVNPSPMSRLKNSISNKGKHNPSAETRAKISAANKGKIMSAEARAKISKNSASRRPEVKAKMSASRMGIPNVNKGRKFTEEEKAVLYATRRGRHWKMSDEGRAKISASKRGTKLSEEHKAKLFEGQKRYIENVKKLKQVDPNEE